jgi:hypothetical protein
MTRKSSPRSQRRRSLDGGASERARIVAAFMGLLVEQSVKRIDIGQIAAAGDVSFVQLRAELDSTITVLAAHVERIDRLALADENVGIAERDRGLAMLLSAVLRTWLDGEDPNLTRAVSALDRASAWAAPRLLPR